MKRAFMVSASLAAYLIFSTSAIEASNDPRASQLAYRSWTKVCISSTCFVGVDALGACVPSGGSAAIISTGDKPVSLSIQLGTKRTLEGAISVQVDQDAPILIPHPECDGLGCRGKLEINHEFIEGLKRSQTITLAATTTALEKLSLSLSLADFAKVYDGPASDPPEVREEILSPDKYKEMVQQEEERRKALECKD
jgi:invasion protein IalB